MLQKGEGVQFILSHLKIDLFPIIHGAFFPLPLKVWFEEAYLKRYLHLE